MTVGLLAIMLDEATYIDRWAESVRRAGCSFDQMIIVDGGSSDGTAERAHALGFTVVPHLFPNHFSDQRNFGCDQLTTDWIFELDADEIPTLALLAGMPAIIQDAERAEMDCVGIARFNFLDGTLVAGPGFKGLDYQYRLHNRRCHWRGAVHEEITGYRTRYELKIDDGHFIVHDKSSMRHTVRNDFYKSLIP